MSVILFAIFFNIHIIALLAAFAMRQQRVKEIGLCVAALLALLHFVSASVPMLIEGMFQYSFDVGNYPSGGGGTVFEGLGQLRYFSMSAGYSSAFSMSIALLAAWSGKCRFFGGADALMRVVLLCYGVGTTLLFPFYARIAWLLS